MTETTETKKKEADEEIAEIPAELVVEPAEPGKEKREERRFDAESWKPKTALGRKVKNGEITSIDPILNSGLRILEPQIVDMLLPTLTEELLMVGQAKGKFGGGQRRTFRQTQKKTAEGNKPSFGTLVVVGNGNGYVGLGYGKSKETVPAREKAMRHAKLNITKVLRGCGSWQCFCKSPHSIPFEVTGKCGSATIKLIPAPKGTGLRVASECKKLLAAAGIKDVWSQTLGQTRTTINLVPACYSAIKQLTNTKIKQKNIDELGIITGEK